MPKMSIDDVRPGMTLADDLSTGEGRTLLPCGTMLTEAHIRTCRVWGIGEILIQEEDEGEEKRPTSFDEIDPEVLDACKILAAQRFVLNPLKHPVVKEMARIYVLHQATGLDAEQARWMVTASPHDDTVDFFPTQPERIQRISPDAVVKQEVELASLPDIFYHITESLDDPRSSAAFVAEIISKDVALSAKLLKLVNTPFYGFPSKIDTLSRAVTIVGTDQLTNLALGVSVLTAFAGIPEEYFTLKEFWLHSVTCGTVARLLASKAGLHGDEKYFVAGLLHDIGRLIMLKNHPEASSEVLRQAKVGRRALVEVERSLWGCTHADIGGKLLKAWNLPPFLQKLTEFHHTPTNAPMSREAAVIHLADFITHGVGLGASGASLVPLLNETAWDSLGLHIADLDAVCRKAEHQASDVMAVFFS